MFYFFLILLIIISLYPGSILGLFFYGDLRTQPGGGPWTNHFFCYLIISHLGFYSHENFKIKKLFVILLTLSIILEVIHIIIPIRTFEFTDLFANIAGVCFAYIYFKFFLIN
ncbi:MAG: hypothetical protein CBC24_06175 [Candidatus Pelagibacter sp. TMED64]|nr:hypothetical protein [Candidatus Pelagibacter sp.]OUU65065.1 MAG: hypothetical protein CBC24_06175 [Candidatus Pelagibacter sp. TMED64]